VNPFDKLKKYLIEHDVLYKEFHHAPVRTSEEAAALRPNYTLSQGAKALIIEAKYSNSEKKYCMFVLPADKRINSKKIKKILHCKSISFASEAEVVKITYGILPGGVHPFGNLFNLPVYTDPLLGENEEIIFNAGDRSISVALKYRNFVDLVKPVLVSFIQN
jgi:Ala-tRNA(Pro) deacylase